MSDFLKIIGGLTMLILSFVWSGLVLKVLWGWFFVPIFGLPNLNIPQALGIALVVSYLTHRYNEDNRKPAVVLAYAFVIPAFALLVGWIYTWFM